MAIGCDDNHPGHWRNPNLSISSASSQAALRRRAAQVILRALRANRFTNQVNRAVSQRRFHTARQLAQHRRFARQRRVHRRGGR